MGLAARNQLSTPHGRLMTGILLLQDLAIVALLLLVLDPLGAHATVGRRSRLGKGHPRHRRRRRFLAAGAAHDSSHRHIERTARGSSAAILVASIGHGVGEPSLLGLSMAIGAFLRD